MELLLVHDPAEAEIRNQEIRVIFRRAEEEVFRFQVAMDNSVVMEVGNGRQGGSDQLGCVGFKVGAFATDAIEELTAKCEVGHEVYW